MIAFLEFSEKNLIFSQKRCGKQMGEKRKIFPSYKKASMTLDNFTLNRVNSCNKLFWAQNLYYLKSMKAFFI
jgi:hypothetical protein